VFLVLSRLIVASVGCPWALGGSERTAFNRAEDSYLAELEQRSEDQVLRPEARPGLLVLVEDGRRVLGEDEDADDGAGDKVPHVGGGLPCRRLAASQRYKIKRKKERERVR